MAIPAAIINYNLDGVNKELIKLLQHFAKTIDDQNKILTNLNNYINHLTARVHCLEHGYASRTTLTNDLQLKHRPKPSGKHQPTQNT